MLPAAPLKFAIVDIPLLTTELLLAVVLSFQVEAVGAGLMAGGAAIIGLQPAAAAAVDTAAVGVGGSGDVTAETGAGVGLSCIMEEDEDILGAGAAAGLGVADN